MSPSNDDRRNDAYGWIDSIAPDLLRASRELVEAGEASRVSDESVANILMAAIRFYVANFANAFRLPFRRPLRSIARSIAPPPARRSEAGGPLRAS